MANKFLLNDIVASKLFESKLHFGHSHNKLNIKLVPYILGIRHNISIFNLEKVILILRILYCFLIEVSTRRGFFLLYGGNKNIPFDIIFNQIINKHSIKKLKKQNDLGFYITGYFSKNWIGGTFTNWEIVSKFIQIQLKKKSNIYNNNMQALAKGFIKIIPDVLICFDSNKNILKESLLQNIPVVGIVDSNDNIDNFLYKFLGNNDSLESIFFFCSFLEEALKAGEINQYELFFYYLVKQLKIKLLVKNRYDKK